LIPSSTALPAPPDRPRLRSHLRLQWEEARRQYVLLGPELVVTLNPSGAAIVGRCDGRHTVADIVDELSGDYSTVVRTDDVVTFVGRLASLRLIDAE